MHMTLLDWKLAIIGHRICELRSLPLVVGHITFRYDHVLITQPIDAIEYHNDLDLAERLVEEAERESIKRYDDDEMLAPLRAWVTEQPRTMIQ